MERRQFIAGLAGASLLGASWRLRSAEAASGAAAKWGDYPAAAATAQVPVGQRAKNVLEIFVQGGLSPWESFYAVPDAAWGKAKGWMWWTFHNQVSTLPAADTMQGALAACMGGTPSALTKPFATDSAGVPVSLGPHLMPLWPRDDILERLRVMVCSHEVMPHPQANCLAMTGHPFGAPKVTPLGTSVQHYFGAHAITPAATPYAYVIAPPYRHFETNFLDTAGVHIGTSPPLLLRATPESTLLDALKRANLGPYAATSDQLAGYYANRMRKRLTRPGATNAVRAPAAENFTQALHALENAASLSTLLAAELFKPVVAKTCGFVDSSDEFKMQLDVAVHLLRSNVGTTRHVQVIEPGYVSGPDAPSNDTHESHAQKATRNQWHLWTRLVSKINKPGENDPDKLDLDDTLVVINTEFGRSPWAQSGTGRNHFPYAYCTAMFGGPIGKAQKGFVGRINPDGTATDALTPAQMQAAVLAALGIYPFMSETFAVSDMGGAASEAAAALHLKKVVLGLS